MKYAFILQTISQGGAERVVSILSNTLTEIGEDVSIIKFFSVDGEYAVSKKVRVYSVSDGDVTAYHKMGRIQRAYALRKILKKIQPDCIIPFTYPVAQLTELATVGMKVNVFQTIRINPALGPAQNRKRWLRDHLVYRSKCTFVQNAQQKDYFKPKYHSRIHVLSNPVSEELFSVSPKVPNSEFVVSALGRFTEQKNYRLMIDAFSDAFQDEPSAKLIIYGEGPMREACQAYIDEHGMTSKIKLMGRTNDITAVFRESDLYVLSSDWEGMPNALIEAMACHVLCISTDCPTGPSDLIRGGVNGLLIPVGDRKAMKEAMRYAFSLPYSERIAISKRGRETVRNKCSAQSIAREMMSVCETVIKQGKENNEENYIL